MGIIRENINFERGMDPKRSMSLGLVEKWSSLRTGDLLTVKRHFFTNSENRFDDTKSYHVFEKDELLDVGIPPEKYSDGCIGFTVYKEDHRTKDFFMWGFPEEFEDRMEILHRGLQESANFERGLDPKKAMKIGKNFLPYKKGDHVKVWVPGEERIVEVRIYEDEELDSDGRPKIKKMFSNIRPAFAVRRIWIRYNGEVKTANLAIDPESPEEDRWIVNG